MFSLTGNKYYEYLLKNETKLKNLRKHGNKQLR